MGLLTDPTGLHGRPFQILVKHQVLICTALYFGSIGWYLLLAHDQVNSGTYLSENALLPGLVTVGCDVGPEVRNALSELEAESERHPDGIPYSWIRARLLRSGIQSYTHNFTLNYPLGKGTKYTGKNVYGIILGGGSSTESIVLSVPYRPKSSVHPTTAPGLALLLGISTCFRKQKYWAKDIILLVTEHEQLGMQAWLEAYHGTTCGSPGVLEAGDLESRGGGIQAAINLELHSSKIHSIDVKLSGLNGQLPNLDLANLVHRICSKERVRHTFANKEKVHNMDSYEQWLQSLATMTHMVLTQASGVPDGNHGLFHRFGIEAVTLEGHEKAETRSHVNLNQIGRVIEGVFRSINNLLERFHQSYFFYLLVDTDRFVSIGLYMVCMGLLIGALFVKAFSYYLNLKAILNSMILDTSTTEKPEYPNLNGIGAGICLFWAYSVGLLAINSPTVFTTVLPYSTETSLLFGYAFLTLLTIVLPPLLVRRFLHDKEMVLLNITAIVNLGTLLIAVSMHNFSLAFLASLVIVPMALLVNPSKNGFLRKTLVLLMHPMALALFTVLASALHHFPRAEAPSRTLSGLTSALVLTLLDSKVYGSWTLAVSVLFYLPNWILFWIVAQSKQSVLEEPLPKSKAD